MGRPYDELPGFEKEQKHLCPGKIFAGNPKLAIAINDNSHDIYFALEEREKYCNTLCQVRNECTDHQKQAIVNVFLQESKEGEKKTKLIGS